MRLINLPPDFKDRSPDRGPFFDVNLVMPVRNATPGCLFADGHTEPATWTGKLWWTYHGEVHPIGWREAVEGHSIGTGMHRQISEAEMAERRRKWCPPLKDLC